MSEWKCRCCHGEMPEPSTALWQHLDTSNRVLRQRGERLLTIAEVLMCTPCYRVHRLAPGSSEGLNFADFVPRGMK